MMKLLEIMQHLKNYIDSFSFPPSFPFFLFSSVSPGRTVRNRGNSKTSIPKMFAFRKVLNVNSTSIYGASTAVLGDTNDIQSSVFLKGIT